MWNTKFCYILWDMDGGYKVCTLDLVTVNNLIVLKYFFILPMRFLDSLTFSRELEKENE